MSFKIEDDEVYSKYNEIWNNIKKLLGGINLNSDIIYDDQYIKTRVKLLKWSKLYLIMIKYLKKRKNMNLFHEKKIKNLIDYDLDSDYESD